MRINTNVLEPLFLCGHKLNDESGESGVESLNKKREKNSCATKIAFTTTTKNAELYLIK